MKSTPAPHTGKYIATEDAYNGRYIEEGETFDIEEGELIPSYLEPVDKTAKKEMPSTHIETELKDDAAIREKAKELGISNYWNKSIDNLKADIEAESENSD